MPAGMLYCIQGIPIKKEVLTKDQSVSMVHHTTRVMKL